MSTERDSLVVEVTTATWDDVANCWARFDGSMNEIILRGRVETIRRDACVVLQRAMQVAGDRGPATTTTTTTRKE
jgi:hypothetical protein